MPVTKVRQNIYKIIEQVRENSEPIQITSRKGNAILIGDLKGKFSRRINIQHRIIYEVLKEKIVKVYK